MRFQLQVVDICVFRVIVLTGCETRNKYRLRNSVGQQVYFAQEGALLNLHFVVVVVVLLVLVCHCVLYSCYLAGIKDSLLGIWDTRCIVYLK